MKPLLRPDEAAAVALLRLLEQHPEYSQRQLPSELGVSLGKTHYLLKALLAKGWVKAQNFQRSNRKLGYLYVLTPSGIRERLRLTQAFLARKEREYEQLRSQITALRQDVASQEGTAAMSTPVVPVILSGGSGTRLWPLSRAQHPKQYLALAGDATLFQQASLRLAALREPRLDVAAPCVVVNEEHRFTVLDQLRDAGIEPGVVILEPVGRNTAPALTLAALDAAPAAPIRSSGRRSRRPCDRRPRRVYAGDGRAVAAGRRRRHRRLSASAPTARTPASATSAAARRQPGAAAPCTPSSRSPTARRRSLPRRRRLLLEWRHLRAAASVWLDAIGATAPTSTPLSARHGRPAAPTPRSFAPMAPPSRASRPRASTTP